MRNFILGTDWWTDCDDAVALRIIARAHKAGEICLKGIGINACMEHSVTSLEGMLNLEGVRDITIGIDLGATDFDGNPPYQKRLSASAEKYKSNEDAEDAVRMYRRIMAEADEPLEIMEIGYLQVIANVLKSLGDDISPKSGIELMKEKVSKIWVMAGKWDVDFGKENNFIRTPKTCEAGNYFCENCPVPVTFLGWEVGVTVISGDNLKEDDHLHLALCDHGSIHGRMSWDPMLAELALIGDEEAAGYDVVTGKAWVDGNSGENRFFADPDGIQKYVVKNQLDKVYKDRINKLIE